ncbi:uncharacterized protein [Parasteatoda tepidariorum]|nr:uncharacterized protein LOC107450646 isoform X2 [Parasteatoda tepidariorum]
MFHLGKKRFTDDQRKSWIMTINKKRSERSLSNIPTEYETEASKEVAHLKFTEEEISSFCDRLDKDDYWDTTKSKEMLVPESETSSDSEVEMEESEIKPPHQTPRRSPRHKPKRPSWKEYKKGKNFESAYFKGQIEHFGVKKVIKKIVKIIWRKKKQQYIEKGESSSIEVGKNEVQHLLFEAVGFMEKRYLGQIKAAALSIYPSEDDKFESVCESGTYDSQDDWFPNKETEGSKISKMSVSVPTSTLKEYGLLDILIATLPMTLNYNDPADTLEFVEILKRARNRVPEHISFKNIPTMSKSERVEKHSGKTIICTALVEPPPDFERLERTGAKDYLKQIPTQDDEESETKSISNGVKNHLKLELNESKSESPMQLDTETSEDMKFIDESSAEESEDTVPSEDSDQLKRGRSPVSPNTASKKKSPEQ